MNYILQSSLAYLSIVSKFLAIIFTKKHQGLFCYLSPVHIVILAFQKK
jgi:hypothetical protein